MQKQKVLKGSRRTGLGEMLNSLLRGWGSLASPCTSLGVWGRRLWVQKAQFIRVQDELHQPRVFLLPLQQP